MISSLSSERGGGQTSWEDLISPGRITHCQSLRWGYDCLWQREITGEEMGEGGQPHLEGLKRV